MLEADHKLTSTLSIQSLSQFPHREKCGLKMLMMETFEKDLAMATAPDAREMLGAIASVIDKEGDPASSENQQMLTTQERSCMNTRQVSNI
jgi:hypothetical protein